MTGLFYVLYLSDPLKKVDLAILQFALVIKNPLSRKKNSLASFHSPIMRRSIVPPESRTT
jgi:hypothetical protein